MSTKFDYIIVGAGFSGAVLAQKLSKKNKKILIIEKRKHIGGNCFDYVDENNILIHKYGPHLFHTNNEKVFEFLSKFTEWDIYNHKVKAYIDGQKSSIPFNIDTLYELFPKSLAEKFELKLVSNYEYNAKIPILELKKSKDKDLQFLANYIYEKVFLNYTSKQWGMKPDEIDAEVTARVPIFIGRDKRYFNDKFQVVPSKGYTKLFESLLDSGNIKVLLNTDFFEICSLKNNKVFLFENEYKGKVIYTGMIDELFDYKFGKLPYRSVNMKFEILDSEYFQEVGTVNYPNSYDFTRITEFKHIHKTTSNKTTILKEYPVPYKKGENTPYYPVFTEENQKKYNKYYEESKKYESLILIGRLAEYKYYDMDDIVERALKLYDEELS